MSSVWLYRKDGRRGDAVSTARLRELVSTGFLKATDHVYNAKSERWVEIGKIKDLRQLLPDAPKAAPKPEAPAPKKTAAKKAVARQREPEQAAAAQRVQKEVNAAPAAEAPAPVASTRASMRWWIAGGSIAALLALALIWPMLSNSEAGDDLSVVNAASQAQVQKDAALFEKEIQPILKTYCYNCHGPDKQKADLNFADFKSRADVQKNRKLWRVALDMIANGEMPPSKAKAKPKTEEIDVITAWIDRTVKEFNCTGEADPGRVTIRRLNRTEYNRTVRDLLGVDFKPAKDFPSDDVDGEGFDNNGDVLSMPPILMEKYLDAAETVMAEAIVANTRPVIDTHELTADRFKGKWGVRDGAVGMLSGGESFAKQAIRRAGRYTVRIWAWETRAGDERSKLGVSLDGKPVKEFSVSGSKGKPSKLEFEHVLGKGERKIGIAFLNDYYNPDAKNEWQRDRNLYVQGVELIGPLDAKAPTLPESHRRIFVAHPDQGMPKRDAARQVITAFVNRAYRRPAETREVDQLLGVFDMADRGGETFERSIQLALTGALINPNFLFRVEPDRPGEGKFGAYALNDWEMASRLSYFLWSSMPDAALFRAAAEGRLSDPAELERQVKRMLADPKSRALVDNFAAQWLQLRDLYTIEPDPKHFPEFKKDLRDAMYEEVAAHFQHVMREDRPILELLDADYTFVNERLARHYDIGGVTGDAFQKVAVDRSKRGGLLTTAGILTLTSDPTRTSPVKRGKWVLMNVLGTPPPPPPPVVPDLEETEKHAGGKKLTLREKMDLHSKDPICASCHKRMDPIGFGLQNFDAIGRWRDQLEGKQVDASGVLPGGRSFNGPAELRSVLAEKKDLFVNCITEKMLVYALGRGLEYTDACTVKGVTDALAKREYRFSALVVAIIKSAPFRYRRPVQTVEVSLHD